MRRAYALCDKGLRAWRSLAVGQGRDPHRTIRPSTGLPGQRSQEGLRDLRGVEVSVYEVGGRAVVGAVMTAVGAWK